MDRPSFTAERLGDGHWRFDDIDGGIDGGTDDSGIRRKCGNRQSAEAGQVAWYCP
jgi:hypothetical protein